MQTSRHSEARLDLLTLLLSWQTEQPPSAAIDEEEGSGGGMSIDATVRQAMEASRKESSQAFRSLVEQQ